MNWKVKMLADFGSNYKKGVEYVVLPAFGESICKKIYDGDEVSRYPYAEKIGETKERTSQSIWAEKKKKNKVEKDK